MGNGFSLVKFTNAIDCNRVFEGQLCLSVGKSIVCKYGQTNFDPVEQKLQSILLWIRLPRLPV